MRIKDQISYFVSKYMLMEEQFCFGELLLYNTVNGLPRLEVSRLLVQILLESILRWHLYFVWCFPQVDPLETILEDMKRLRWNSPS